MIVLPYVMPETLIRIANFVVELTPLRVFAIMAGSAGTLGIEDFRRLEVYADIVLSLPMALWLLPGLVVALTPVRCADILGKTRDMLVTAFATGSLFVYCRFWWKTAKPSCGVIAMTTGPAISPSKSSYRHLDSGYCDIATSMVLTPGGCWKGISVPRFCINGSPFWYPIMTGWPSVPGNPSPQCQPRWSVIRDVLHWVE